MSEYKSNASVGDVVNVIYAAADGFTAAGSELATVHLDQAAQIIESAGVRETGLRESLAMAGERRDAAVSGLQIAGDSLRQYVAGVTSSEGVVVHSASAAAIDASVEQQAEPPLWRAVSDPALLRVSRLPGVVALTDDGELLVTERVPDGSTLISRQDKPLYTPQPASPERRAEIEEAARRLGLTLEQLASATVDAAAFHADPAVGHGVKHMWMDEGELPLLEVLQASQELACNQEVAERAAARGRELLQRYVPGAVPQERTLVAATADTKLKGSYYGKYGGAHVITLSPRGVNGPEDIERDACDDGLAITAAHELAHQHHAESHGLDVLLVSKELPASAPYNTTDASDPHDALVRGIRYLESTHKVIALKDEIAQAEQLVGVVSELYAYAVEQELRVGMGAQSLIDTQGQLRFSARGAEYLPMVELLLGPNAPMSRTRLIDTLRQIDIRQFPTLPPEVLEGALLYPSKLLALPKKQSAEIS